MKWVLLVTISSFEDVRPGYATLPFYAVFGHDFGAYRLSAKNAAKPIFLSIISGSNRQPVSSKSEMRILYAEIYLVKDKTTVAINYVLLFIMLKQTNDFNIFFKSRSLAF